MSDTSTSGAAGYNGESIISVDRVTALQSEWTRRLHEDESPIRLEPPWRLIESNHRMNFAIWHAEDAARRDDLGAERVRDAKRLIDRSNQARNDAIEEIDEWIAARLPHANPDASLHSETPGMMIDRLSILALKLYHMEEEAERGSADAAHREACARRAEIILTQRNDLRDCLDMLFRQLARGERAFRLYRQFKMYNDPTLNPEIYLHVPKAKP